MKEHDLNIPQVLSFSSQLILGLHLWSQISSSKGISLDRLSSSCLRASHGIVSELSISFDMSILRVSDCHRMTHKNTLYRQYNCIYQLTL